MSAVCFDDGSFVMLGVVEHVPPLVGLCVRHHELAFIHFHIAVSSSYRVSGDAVSGKATTTKIRNTFLNDRTITAVPAAAAAAIMIMYNESYYVLTMD